MFYVYNAITALKIILHETFRDRPHYDPWISLWFFFWNHFTTQNEVIGTSIEPIIVFLRVCNSGRRKRSCTVQLCILLFSPSALI